MSDPMADDMALLLERFDRPDLDGYPSYTEIAERLVAAGVTLVPHPAEDGLGCNPECIWKSSHLYACGTRIANLEAQLAQPAPDARLRAAAQAALVVLEHCDWNGEEQPDCIPALRAALAESGGAS